jgi:hypothetical protein
LLNFELDNHGILNKNFFKDRIGQISEDLFLAHADIVAIEAYAFEGMSHVNDISLA